MSDAAGIRQNIEIIEESYEFMLAYAAQGRAEEGAGPDGAHIRTFLDRFAEAAQGLNDQVSAMLGKEGAKGAGLLDSFKRDSATIISLLRLMLDRKNLSSEVIDNTNGLISMRSYLTTLFFIDKAVLSEGE
ncbi:MAG: hypothetical protein OEY85_14905 [Rhodospirillales bacterium]|nr:hypothetical protein [Rhodospirillales bacterium]